MGIRTGRCLTFTALTLFIALACGGRSLKDGDGSTGENSAAGAQNTSAGAQNSAGANQSTAGAPAGGNDSWSACDYDEDCTLLSNGCCPPSEPVTASDLVAVNAASSYDYSVAQCPEPHPCVGPAEPTEYDQTLKYFRALCFHRPSDGVGRCQVLDTRSTPYASCVASSDCVLRAGVSCCPGCDSKGWVPVNSTANFCTRPTACGLCISLPPSGLETSCQGGTCRFVPPTR